MTPRSDGHNRVRVAQVLEALQASLDNGGAPQSIGAATIAPAS